jgi:hypothetical protein
MSCPGFPGGHVTQVPVQRQGVFGAGPGRVEVPLEPRHDGETEQGVGHPAPVTQLLEPGQAGAEQLDGLAHVTPHGLDEGEVVPAFRRLGGVADRLQDGECLLVIQEGPGRVVLPISQAAPADQRLGPGVGPAGRRGKGQGLVRPPAPGAEVAVEMPVPPEGFDHSEGDLALVVRDSPCHRGPKVLVFGRQAFHHLKESGFAQLRLRRLGEIQEVQGMATPNDIRLIVLLQPLQPELADRLEQVEADPTGLVRPSAHQAGVEQRLEAIQQCDADVAMWIADGLRGLQREPSGEHGQAAKQGAKVVVEEVMAPGDGPTQRSLAGRKVAGITRQQRETPIEPLKQGLRTQQSKPRGGQLDG